MVRSTEYVRLKDSDTALLCIDEYAIEQRFAQFMKALAGTPSTRRRDSASLLFERFLQSRVAGGPAHMGMAVRLKNSDTALLCIDEYAIEQGFAQFTKALAGTPSTRRRDSARLLFERFLQSRVADGPAHMGMAQSNDVVTFLRWLDSCSEKRRTAVHARDCEAVGASELSKCFLHSRVAGGPAHMGMAQSNDVVTFLCWLDSCSEKRRTAVHARDCEAVGTSELPNCSTTEERCTLRYAHDSLRTNYVSKLAMAYE